MLNKDLIREIRAMLERHWSADAIASRMKIDISTVNTAIHQLRVH